MWEEMAEEMAAVRSRDFRRFQTKKKKKGFLGKRKR
jgi:hypothetical protein